MYLLFEPFKTCIYCSKQILVLLVCFVVTITGTRRFLLDDTDHPCTTSVYTFMEYGTLILLPSDVYVLTYYRLKRDYRHLHSLHGQLKLLRITNDRRPVPATVSLKNLKVKNQNSFHVYLNIHERLT